MRSLRAVFRTACEGTAKTTPSSRSGWPGAAARTSSGNTSSGSRAMPRSRFTSSASATVRVITQTWCPEPRNSHASVSPHDVAPTTAKRPTALAGGRAVAALPDFRLVSCAQSLDVRDVLVSTNSVAKAANTK